MTPGIQILIILFIHWVADFLLQTKDMAMNKSKSNFWLALHVGVYALTFFIPGIFFGAYSGYFTADQLVVFTIVTFVCHFVTDYLTSRWTSKLYADQKFYGFPSFFSVIGLDQFLHYLQLILTYEFLVNR